MRSRVVSGGVSKARHSGLLEQHEHPGQAAQLIRASAQCQGCGLDPGSGHIQEAINECLSGTTNRCFSLFPFLSLSKINKRRLYRVVAMVQ